MLGLKHRLTATYSESTGPFEPFSLTTPRRRRKFKKKRKKKAFHLQPSLQLSSDGYRRGFSSVLTQDFKTADHNYRTLFLRH